MTDTRTQAGVAALVGQTLAGIASPDLDAGEAALHALDELCSDALDAIRLREEAATLRAEAAELRLELAAAKESTP